MTFTAEARAAAVRRKLEECAPRDAMILAFLKTCRRPSGRTGGWAYVRLAAQLGVTPESARTIAYRAKARQRKRDAE